jgi:AcrR family transcriptional regulator
MAEKSSQRHSKPQRQPVRLDRDKILTAAVEVAEELGPTGMTMREVGARLEADPTAIYRHFRSKDELVAAMADRLFAEMLTIEPEGSWRERLRHDLHAGRAIYRSHPAFVDVLAHLQDETASLQRINERTLGCLVEAGLPEQEIGVVHQIIVAYVIGTGVLESAWTDPGGGDMRAASRRAYAALPPDEYPASSALAPSLFPDEETVFAYAVDLLLDAIEHRARLAADVPPARPRRRPL